MIFVILKILLITLLGFSLLRLLKFTGEWQEKLGLSFLVGSGLISVVYFLFIWGTNRVLSTDFWAITTLITLALIFFGGLKFKIPKFKFPKIDIKSNFFVIVCWTAIVFLFLCAVIYTSNRPPYTNDTLYLFDFRAKIMYLAQQLSEIKRIVNWYSFPMFTSMIGLIWRFLGTDNPSSYYPIMYFSFTLIFYSVLKKVINKNLASIGTLLMFTTPITFWQAQMDGMTNIPYTVFLSSSIIYVYKMVLSKKILFADVVVSSMLLGLSAWTRGSEPLWMIPVVMTTLILMVKQKWNLLLPYYLIFFLIWQIWPWYVGRGYTPINSVRSVIAKSVIENDIGRYGFLSSIEYTFESILKLLPQSLGLVFYLFIAFFILNIVYRRFSAGQLYYLSVIVMMLSALFLGSLFMVINFHIPIHIYNDSLSRLLSIFVPLMWFYIMINPGWNIISDLFKLKLK